MHREGKRHKETRGTFKHFPRAPVTEYQPSLPVENRATKTEETKGKKNMGMRGRKKKTENTDGKTRGQKTSKRREEQAGEKRNNQGNEEKTGERKRANHRTNRRRRKTNKGINPPPKKKQSAQTETNRGRTAEGKTGRGTTEGIKPKQIEKQKEIIQPSHHCLHLQIEKKNRSAVQCTPSPSFSTSSPRIRSVLAHSPLPLH
ncbi:hypothetical protein NC651_018896 [Populus alba x Populus x berolinensis]|nr:hypothetical protein NC651_018896 [Populus alba x Populus x berolinensis]